jgi:hypothetical protein
MLAVQALAKQSDAGRAALADLLVRLGAPAGDASPMANEADGAALAGAVMRGLAARLPRVTDGGLSTSASMVLTDSADSQRSVCLMTQEEAARLPSPLGQSRGPGGGALPSTALDAPAGDDGQPDAQQYVRYVARAVARWVVESGHGTVEVVEHGSMIQLGETRARLICPGGLDSLRSERGGAGGGQGCNAAEQESVHAWAWEVLWGGSSEHVADATLLSEALMATAGGT